MRKGKALAMSLACLPNPAINLIFRFLSHPTADMIREVSALEGGLQRCDECGRPFERYDRGLWMTNSYLLCPVCIPRIMDHDDFSPGDRANALLALQCVYPHSLRRMARWPITM